MSIFTAIGKWFAKVFSDIKQDGVQVAVAITEGIQAGLKSGLIASIADILPGSLPKAILALLQAEIPKILAAELAIEGLPANPTAADIQTFETSVLNAFGLVSDKSKLWTTLAAQIYGIIQSQVAAGTSFTFAVLVGDVETAYQDFLADQADDNDTVS